MAKNKGKKDSIEIEDIEIEDEAPKAKGKKSKKQAEPAPAQEAPKGKAKGAAAKAEKGKQPEHLKREALPEGYVTAEQLAEEFGKKGRDVRQVLRDNEFEKPENGRWAWHEKKDAGTLKRLRGILGGVTPKGSKAKKEEEEAPAPKGKKSKK